MVRWEDGTLTTPGRRVLKDMEDKEESKSLTGIDKIIDQYSRDPEIKEYFDRETLLITIKFLYKVVQGVIDNSPISLTLAVNLIPKIEKKNSQKLQDTIEEIYKEGFDDNYIYTNFMISSKKYLGSKDTTTKDFLFQK